VFYVCFLVFLVVVLFVRLKCFFKLERMFHVLFNLQKGIVLLWILSVSELHVIFKMLAVTNYYFCLSLPTLQSTLEKRDIPGSVIFHQCISF